MTISALATGSHDLQFYHISAATHHVILHPPVAPRTVVAVGNTHSASGAINGYVISSTSNANRLSLPHLLCGNPHLCRTRI